MSHPQGEKAPTIPARRCKGCGHIETKNVEGAFRCGRCGGTEFNLYLPDQPGADRPRPAAPVPVTPLKPVAKPNTCQRCGAPVHTAEEGQYCERCLRALDLD